MPDYDLGTAQGTIQFKVDGAGIQTATGDLDKFKGSNAQVVPVVEKTGAAVKETNQTIEKVGPASEEAERGHEVHRSALARLGGGLITGAGHVATFVAGLGIAELASKGIEGGIELVHKSLEGTGESFEQYSQQVKDVSRVTGDSTEKTSGLLAAMQLSGSNSDKAGLALGRLSRNLSNASDTTKGTAKFTDALGFSFQDAHGKILPMSELLPKIADRFQAMPDGANKSALAMQLFGKQGIALLPFLNQGSKGIEEFTGKAKAMGLVIDSTSDKIRESARVSLAEFKSAVEGAKVSVGADTTAAMDSLASVVRSVLTPALGGIATAANIIRPAMLKLLEACEQLGDKIKGVLTPIFESLGQKVGNALVGKITALADGIEKFTSKLGDGGGGLKGFIASIEKADPVIGNVVKAFSALSPFGPIIVKLFEELGPAIAKIVPPLQSAVIQLLPSLVKIIGSLVPLVKPLADVIVALAPLLGLVADAIVAVVGALTPLLKAGAEFLTMCLRVISGGINPLTAATEALHGKFGPLAEIVARVALAIGTAIGLAIRGAIQFFQNFIGTVQNVIGFLGGVVGAVASFASGFVQAISTGFRAAVGVVTSVIQDIVNTVRNILGTIGSVVSGALAGIGGFFTSAFSGVSGAVSGPLNAVIGVVRSILGGIGGVISGALAGIGGFFSAAFSTVSGIVSGILDGVVGVIRGIIGTVGGVISAGLSTVTNAFNTVFNALAPIVQSAFSSISSIIGSVISIIGSLITAGLAIVRNTFTTVFNALAPIVQGAFNTVQGVVTSVIGAVRTAIETGLNAVHTTFTNIFNALAPIVQGALNTVRGVVTTVMDAVRNTFETVLNAAKNVVQTALDAIRNTFQTVLNAAKSVVQTALDTIRETFTTVLNAAKNVVQTALDAIRNTFETVLNAAKNTVQTALDAVRNAFNTGLNAAKQIVSDAMGAIGRAVQSGIQDVVGFFQGLGGKITGALQGVVGDAFSAGASIVGGLVKGLLGGLGDIANAAGQIAAKVKAALPHSPAKEGPFSGRGWQEVYESGRAIVSQFATGLTSGRETLGQAMSELAANTQLALHDLSASGALNLNTSVNVGGRQTTVGALGSGLVQGISSAAAAINTDGGRTLNYNNYGSSSISSDADLIRVMTRARTLVPGW